MIIGTPILCDGPLKIPGLRDYDQMDVKKRILWLVIDVPSFCVSLFILGFVFGFLSPNYTMSQSDAATQSAFFCYLSLPPLLPVMGFPRKVVRRRALANTWQAEPRVRPIVCWNLHCCDWQDMNTPEGECSALFQKFSMETAWFMACSVTVVFVDSHSRLWIISAKLPA
jgi:hypothetical protein